jgi:hypothetical protein
MDLEAETKYELSLQQSMALARKRKLLAGISIISTPKVIPGPTTLKMIIEAAGGTVNLLLSNFSILRSRHERILWILQRKQIKIRHITCSCRQ